MRRHGKTLTYLLTPSTEELVLAFISPPFRSCAHRSLRPSVITECSLACGDMQILRGCGDGELVQPDSNDLQRVVRLQPVHATPTGLAQRPSTTTTTSSCCQSTRAVVVSGRQQACARVYTVRRTDGGRVQSSRPPRSDHHRRRRFLPPRNRQHRAVLTRTRSRKGQDFNLAVLSYRTCHLSLRLQIHLHDFWHYIICMHCPRNQPLRLQWLWFEMV